MSCDCGKCREHFRTLGIAYGVPSESEIQEAYKESAKQWHPDLYENFASLRADAEEHFKHIQIAYRELKEHNGTAGESPTQSAGTESPVQSAWTGSPAESVRTEAVREAPKDTPSISFGSALGCQVAPHFTPEAEEIISRYLGKLGTALAIVDLGGSYTQFLLLAQLGILVRDARSMVSMLWYKDLGEISLAGKQGKASMWQSLVGGASGSQHKSTLEIYRNNGMLFYSVSSQVDDSVKKVIYDFLLHEKLHPHP
jgi:hypothetical protein